MKSFFLINLVYGGSLLEEFTNSCISIFDFNGTRASTEGIIIGHYTGRYVIFREFLRKLCLLQRDKKIQT